jgi:Patatin-like phospholipase
VGLKPVSGPFTLSEILQDELDALDPSGAADRAAQFASLPIRDSQRLVIDDAEKGRRRRLYQMAYAQEFSALSLSGGGIRSACFALGIIQGLADKGLLQQFNYLSTVSGGGYIGSWLSAWLHHAGDADQVLKQLLSRRQDADDEFPPINHLREYSAYLTPKVGLFSADTWAALAIVLRNLLLNWLILVPAIALPVVAVKFVAALVHAAPSAGSGSAVALALACLAFVALGFGYKLFRLYSAEYGTEKTADASLAQRQFLLWSLTPVLVAAVCFVWLANRGETLADPLVRLLLPAAWAPATGSLWPMVVLALIVYGGAIAVAFIRASSGVPLSVALGESRPFALRPKDFAAWVVAVFVFATLVWAPFAIGSSQPDVTLINAIRTNNEFLLVVFGVPWFLLSSLLAHTTYLFLRSYSREGDVEREWLGRASGWHLIAALVWVVLSSLVLLGPKIYYARDFIIANGSDWLTAFGTISGVITAFLGKSSATPEKGEASDWKGISSNLVLAVSGPLFVAILVIMLSVVVDWAVLGYPWSIEQACFSTTLSLPGCGPWPWFLVGVVLLAVTLFADLFVNVNRFSLHALYRNRLIRAFLGGARAPDRRPEGFTGFDWNDNLRVASLWPGDPKKNWRPFHVINMTLNLASTRNLAWQQRKGASFAVTPRFCGSADLGYRKTEEYGDPQGGISLGTAMAVSGAAVSPNMGYHSSPSIAFLLTLFNVRLGWWLGNPGKAGDRLAGAQRMLQTRLVGSSRPLAPYAKDAPRFSLRPLLAELFGLTNEDSAYVYLSDGGHFENLGLYEMVRRRCRWIIVCDGAQDAGRGYEDLGNATRKIWIDLGVRVHFPDAPLLKATKDTKPAELPYFMLGTIEYLSDGGPAETSPRSGRILYIKPAVRSDEGVAEFIAYQRLKPDFPNQSTADQWFDEPQLEAYRTLGYYILTTLVTASGLAPPMTLEDLFTRLDPIDPITFAPRNRDAQNLAFIYED